MGRIVIYIIFMVVSMVLSIVSPRHRRSMYGRNYYGDDHTMDYIRMFIRRRRALSKAKRFIKRKRHNITLKNSNVILMFDTKFKTFVLLDIKNTKRSASVILAEQEISMQDLMDYSTEVDTEMEKTFDNICHSFSEISNYLGILQILKQRFNNVKENNPKQEVKPVESEIKEQTQIIQPPKDKVNINSLSEKELAELPGISIIQAKRIIDRINFKGNFNSLDEFYNEMKIKSHFQKKLNKIICVKPTEKKRQTDNDDRIIDL